MGNISVSLKKKKSVFTNHTRYDSWLGGVRGVAVKAKARAQIALWKKPDSSSNPSEAGEPDWEEEPVRQSCRGFRIPGVGEGVDSGLRWDQRLCKQLWKEDGGG